MAGAEVIRVDAAQPDPAVLRHAADLIRAGQLVAFPTETVYGVGANAFDADAVARIYQAKRRVATNPLIVHLASARDLPQVAAAIPPLAATLGDRFWPGPLTLVLPRGPRIPLNVTAGLDTVAVRVPAHPVALGLLNAAGLPVAAPSANLFMRPSATRAADVVADLREHVALILDAGPTPHGLESTVLDLVGPPRILRPGALTLEALRAVLPDLPAPDAPPPDHASDSEPMLAPGMMLKHYAPRAAMLVFDGDDPARVLAAVEAAARAALVNGQTVGLLLNDQDLAALRTRLAALDVHSAGLGDHDDLAGQGRLLFAALRDLDQTGVDVIITALPPPRGIGLTLRDRLRRAASGQVQRVV